MGVFGTQLSQQEFISRIVDHLEDEVTKLGIGFSEIPDTLRPDDVIEAITEVVGSNYIDAGFAQNFSRANARAILARLADGESSRAKRKSARQQQTTAHVIETLIARLSRKALRDAKSVKLQKSDPKTELNSQLYNLHSYTFLAALNRIFADRIFDDSFSQSAEMALFFDTQFSRATEFNPLEFLDSLSTAMLRFTSANTQAGFFRDLSGSTEFAYLEQIYLKLSLWSLLIRKKNRGEIVTEHDLREITREAASGIPALRDQLNLGHYNIDEARHLEDNLALLAVEAIGRGKPQTLDLPTSPDDFDFDDNKIAYEKRFDFTPADIEILDALKRTVKTYASRGDRLTQALGRSDSKELIYFLQSQVKSDAAFFAELDLLGQSADEFASLDTILDSLLKYAAVRAGIRLDAVENWTSAHLKGPEEKQFAQNLDYSHPLLILSAALVLGQQSGSLETYDRETETWLVTDSTRKNLTDDMIRSSRRFLEHFPVSAETHALVLQIAKDRGLIGENLVVLQPDTTVKHVEYKAAKDQGRQAVVTRTFVKKPVQKNFPGTIPHSIKNSLSVARAVNTGVVAANFVPQFLPRVMWRGR